MMISSQEQATLSANIEKYEGRVNHMYLDSRGYVTVGVGHLLASVEKALLLPFKYSDGNLAPPEEIQREYEFLLTQPANKIASFYQPFMSLTLDDQAIDELTHEHIHSFYRELKIIYPEFDSYPSAVRLATFDLIFNLGMTKLKNNWPKFNACMAAQDWAGAAENSRRRGIADARNHYVKDLLLTAVEPSIA